MPFVYCNTSKSLLPEKKKSQRLLIFIKIRNRCLNRAPDTFDRTTMAGLMGSSFPLSLTGRLQNIKTVRLAGFHYLFQRITLDISNFFSTIVKLCPPVSKWHDFVSKSKRAEEYISTCSVWTLGWPHCFLCLPVDHTNYLFCADRELLTYLRRMLFSQIRVSN